MKQNRHNTTHKKIFVLVDNFCNLLNKYFLPVIHDQ